MNEVVHNYPVLQKTESGWVPFTGKEIGPAHGGMAVTTYSTLERLNENQLINPATGEVFNRTRKGRDFYNAQLGILVRPFLTEVADDE